MSDLLDLDPDLAKLQAQIMAAGWQIVSFYPQLWINLVNGPAHQPRSNHTGWRIDIRRRGDNKLIASLSIHGDKEGILVTFPNNLPRYTHGITCPDDFNARAFIDRIPVLLK